MKRLAHLVGLLFFAQIGLAQNAKPLVAGGTGVIYNKESAFSFGFATTHGWRVGWEKGLLKTYYKTTFFQLNLGEIKHEKEHKQSSDPAQGRSYRAFVYGKRNNFLVVRAGWGAKRYFSEKARQKGVAVGMSYSIGPSLGILKPYYLGLNRTADVPGNAREVIEKYSEANASTFLDNTKIIGAASFFRGLSQPSFLLGGNASIAAHFDWGAFDEYVKAAEVGIQLDLFAKKVPILVGDSVNQALFLNFYAILQFGKRR